MDPGEALNANSVATLHGFTVGLGQVRDRGLRSVTNQEYRRFTQEGSEGRVGSQQVHKLDVFQLTVKDRSGKVLKASAPLQGNTEEIPNINVAIQELRELLHAKRARGATNVSSQT